LGVEGNFKFRNTKEEAGENCKMSDFIILTHLNISEQNQFLAQQTNNVQHTTFTHTLQDPAYIKYLHFSGTQLYRTYGVLCVTIPNIQMENYITFNSYSGK
jgi:hypothetical protein